MGLFLYLGFSSAHVIILANRTYQVNPLASAIHRLLLKIRDRPCGRSLKSAFLFQRNAVDLLAARSYDQSVSIDRRRRFNDRTQVGLIQQLAGFAIE